MHALLKSESKCSHSWSTAFLKSESACTHLWDRLFSKVSRHVLINEVRLFSKVGRYVLFFEITCYWNVILDMLIFETDYSKGIDDFIFETPFLIDRSSLFKHPTCVYFWINIFKIDSNTIPKIYIQYVRIFACIKYSFLALIYLI